jgi:hypothetical protein
MNPLAIATDGYLTGNGIQPLSIASSGYITAVVTVTDTYSIGSGGGKRNRYTAVADLGEYGLPADVAPRKNHDNEDIVMIATMFLTVIGRR